MKNVTRILPGVVVPAWNPRAKEVEARKEVKIVFSHRATMTPAWDTRDSVTNML